MRIVCFFQILKVFIINLSPEIQVIAHNKTDINRDKIYKGNSTVKIVPLSNSLFTEIFPLWASTIHFTIESPSPEESEVLEEST